MPAIDACEPQVIRALEKAGWEVLERQFTIRLPDDRHGLFIKLI
jgi:Holliday junction resolvase-like predicted endonuclease